jgi:hypothetical protein
MRWVVDDLDKGQVEATMAPLPDHRARGPVIGSLQVETGGVEGGGGAEEGAGGAEGAEGAEGTEGDELPTKANKARHRHRGDTRSDAIAAVPMRTDL